MVDYIEKVFLEQVGNLCRLSGCFLANMMGLDNTLLRELSVQMFNKSLSSFFR